MYTYTCMYYNLLEYPCVLQNVFATPGSLRPQAAVDLDRIPDEYLIAASYDPGLQQLAAEKAEANAAIDTAARDVERADCSGPGNCVLARLSDSPWSASVGFSVPTGLANPLGGLTP